MRRRTAQLDAATFDEEIASHHAPTLHYYLLDVFTDRPFSGNPLAVFVDPGPLSDGQMQRIAAELHLSETVFVWSPAHPGQPWRTRIFTPMIELPFAGHPTVGAAFLLAALGKVAPSGGVIDVVLEETVGQVRATVALHESGVPVSAAFLVPGALDAVATTDPEELAMVVGLAPHDLHPDLPVRGYSAGVPFSIIPVADTSALARARVESSRWSANVATTAAPHLYLVTPLNEPGSSLATWRARMFAPAMGITEDPATGAAAAAFAGYLAEIAPSRRNRAVVIHQGVEIGRPSVLSVRIAPGAASGSPTVHVGGPAVVVGHGTLAVPGTR
jgi:trans-2,3-dihydro-3-hydroxyanthranilate isomerase